MMNNNLLNTLRLCRTLSLATLYLLASTAVSRADRVALVSGDGNETANLVAICVARLSSDGNLELLERDEIRRVLDEQKLSQSGLVDASQIIAVGGILKADLFAVVESSPGKDAVPGIIVFDGRSGVRYADVALPPLTELEAAADAVVAAVQSAVKKRGRRVQKLHLAGIVTVRNADLPRTFDPICETIGFLVERALPQSADVAVLERRRLARMNEERALTETSDAADLLAAMSTIDLEIARGVDGQGLQATALVKRSGQVEPDRIAVETPDSNAAALSESLAQKLIEFWKASPVAGRGDHRLEARRFDGEAAHHYSHKRFADAVRTQEAAFALDGSRQEYGGRLSHYLVRYAAYVFSPSELNVTKGGDKAWTETRITPRDLETVLASTQRGMDIDHQLTQQAAHHYLFDTSLAHVCDRLRGQAKVALPPVRQQLEECLEQCRRRSLEHCERWALQAEQDPQWHDAFTSQVHLQCGLIKSASLDTRQYAQCMAIVASRWVDVTNRIPPKFVKSDGGELLNMLLHSYVSPVSWPWPIDEREFAKQMSPVYAAMQKHQRPIVQLYGLFGELRCGVLLGITTDEEAYLRFATEFRPKAISIVESPQPWHPDRTRYSVYEAWRAAIDNMPGKSNQRFAAREILELITFMNGRNEANYKVLQKAFWTLKPQQSMDVVRAVRPVINSPECKESDSEKVRLRSFLQTQEQQILAAHPELATAPASRPWSKATSLFDYAQTHLQVAGCLVEQTVVHAVCLQFESEKASLRLVKIPVNGAGIELLGTADLGLTEAEVPGYARTSFVSAMCMDQHSIYVATTGAGIILFPHKNGTPRRIDISDGLPGNKVSSLAVLDGVVYVGYADGYIAAYDLESRKVDVLASSRRKQKLSPFDDQNIFKVPTLVADPERRRIVFVVGPHLWQYTPADKSFKQILDLIAVSVGRSEPKLSGLNIDRTSRFRGDRLLISNVFHVIELDLARDKAVEIHSPHDGIFQTQPPHLRIGEHLWSGGHFSRLSLDRHEYQVLPNPAGGIEPFRPTICLDSVPGTHQIIAADSFSIWRLDLEAKGDQKP